MTLLKRKLALLLLVLALQSCAIFHVEQTTSIPFRLLNNHVLIPVTINGVEMSFKFDNNAPVTMLLKRGKERLAAETGVELKNIAEAEIKLGKLTLNAIAQDQIKNDRATELAYLANQYFDGIIGKDIFENKVLEINYDQKLISITSQSVFSTVFENRADHWEAVPLRQNQQQTIISMPLTLGEQSRYLDFALDIGSNLDFVLPKAALDKSLTPRYSYSFKSFDLAGKKQFEVYPLDRSYLGDHAIIWPLIHTPVNYSSDSSSDISVVGNAVLSRFNLIFDVEGETLYFQENQRHSIKNFPDRSGLSVSPHQSGALVTSVAVPGSYFLEVNDVIQSYEGIEINKSTFDGFRLMLSSEAEELYVCWLRGRQKMCADLVLAYRM